MNINAIIEALKALGQLFQVSTIFPSILLVVVNAYMVLPRLSAYGFPEGYDTASPLTTTLVVALSLMLSYTLYAFNHPLTRLLEGYKFKPHKFFSPLQREHEARHQFYILHIRKLNGERRKLRDRLEKHPDRFTVESLRGVIAKLAEMERDFDMEYPSALESVLPTTLGNTIAAFEDYPRTRYGMESIALWTRLVPILKDKNYLEFVTQEKMAFDFLMNTGVVAGILGLEIAYLSFFLGEWIWALICLSGTLIASVVFYLGMIRAARQWGEAVRVAFDLHRHDLHRRLYLRSTSSF